MSSRDSSPLSRREALKIMGVTAAVAGLGTRSLKAAEVAPAALGWDLRTLNATGAVTMQIRRGNPPANDGGVGGTNYTAGAYWTHPNTSAGGVDNNRYYYVPVQGSAPAAGSGIVAFYPGTYYIGVQNSGTTAVSYTLQSRGIGTAASSYPLKSQAVAFANGTATITGWAVMHGLLAWLRAIVSGVPGGSP